MAKLTKDILENIYKQLKPTNDISYFDVFQLLKMESRKTKDNINKLGEYILHTQTAKCKINSSMIPEVIDIYDQENISVQRTSNSIFIFKSTVGKELETFVAYKVDNNGDKTLVSSEFVMSKQSDLSISELNYNGSETVYVFEIIWL